MKPIPPLLEAMGVADDPRPRLPGGWFAGAYRVVEAIAALGLIFSADGLRAWADGSGLPPPPDGRAWGSVIALAKRRGLIAFAGNSIGAAKVPGEKLQPVRLWRPA